MGKSLVTLGARPVGLLLHFGARLISFLKLCSDRFQLGLQRANEILLGGGLPFR